MLCMAPGVIAKLEEGNGITFRSAAVLPYMDAEAAQSLLDAAREVPITLNSGAPLSAACRIHQLSLSLSWSLVLAIRAQPLAKEENVSIRKQRAAAVGTSPQESVRVPPSYSVACTCTKIWG